MYSQYSSSPYQPLRADTEGSCTQPCKGSNLLESRYEKRLMLFDFSRRVKPRVIKINECNYRKHATVKHYILMVSVISLNVIGKNKNQLYRLIE